jgi:hypothetical protein
MTLIAIVIVLVVLTFVIGFVAPRKSRRVQAFLDRIFLRGESKGDRRAGPAGDAAEGALEKARRATDRSEEAGRAAHEKLTD